MTHNAMVVSVRTDESDAVRLAVEALASGLLVVLPTDTVYGLAADPRLQGAEDRLRAAKGREPDKPIPILAADVEAVASAGVSMNTLERRLAAAFWPGPLTLVLEIGTRQEGFRVPDCAVTRRILKACGGLLRVTSANLSGEDPARTAAEAATALAGRVAMVLDNGPSPGGTPSSVVRVLDGRLVVIREGAILRETLEHTMREER
jgi:tRNA threonylcarbamoyl adenosine modification protein (Sua5/YciO/YrdC/YwlC family)